MYESQLTLFKQWTLQPFEHPICCWCILLFHAVVYEMPLRVLKFAISHSRGQGSTQGTKQEEVGSISYNGPWHIITFIVPLSPTEAEAKRFAVLVPSLGSSPVHRPRNTICHSGVKWHLSSVISIAASGRPWLRQPYGLWLCVTTVTQMIFTPPASQWWHGVDRLVCVELILTANENSGKIKWKQKTLIRPSGDVFSKRGVDQVLDFKKSITDTVFKAERFLVVQKVHQ